MGDFITRFYESGWLGELIGDMHHPGGERLIEEIGKRCAIDETSHVLDIGCGNGVTTLEIASSFGCTIRGLDISPTLIDEAREKADRYGSVKCVFQLTNGEIPFFLNDTYDAVLFISSLSLFESKLDGLREARRILKPEGTLYISNIVVSERLLSQDSSRMMFASCIAGALPMDSMATLIENAGFKEVVTIDWSHELRRQWATAFMRIQLRKGSKGSPLRRLDVPERDELKEFFRRAEELFDSGALGYCLFIGKK